MHLVFSFNHAERERERGFDLSDFSVIREANLEILLEQSCPRDD